VNIKQSISISRIVQTLILSTLMFVSDSLAALIFPEPNNIYVNDYANLLDEQSVETLKDQLAQVKSEHGIEITLVIINQLSDYGSSPKIEPYATALFNHWGVGNRHENDGIMLLVSLFDRKLRIEIGRGYGMAWDAIMKEVIDEDIVPLFRNNDYQQGIKKGISEIILATTDPNRPSRGFLGTAVFLFEKLISNAKEIGYWWLLVALASFNWFTSKVQRYLRSRPRNCKQCNARMNLIDENSDDAYIDQGQRLEEYLSSVDYYVWLCSQCTHMTINRYRPRGSSVGACQSCNYVTLESDTEVIDSATTYSSGTKKIDYSCLHCGHEDSEIVDIPRLIESSSSSSRSSNSSGFGGGSSSGGGASGSW